MSASAVLAARLAAARAGSTEALGESLEPFRRYLLEVARQAVGSALKAKGGASDLVQETFLEAQRLFPRFDGGSEAQLRAWLRCLLLHKAAKLGRRYGTTAKRQLSREVSLDAGGRCVHPSQIAAPVPTPSVAVASAEQTERLRAAIDRLPGDYRRVMALRYTDGLAFDEVGRRLGRSADAARMLWARAVERLKHELAGADH
ncbi:MAG TPA: sigma-70 family RNA polymerase sigma factor [Gemmataceae bacterium]|jgi:RNA polymerase sigma-70 factor (ECF subfamily)